MKNILFLIQGEDMPSSRVRVLNLLPELKKEFSYCVQKYPKKLSEKINLVNKVKHSDIIFLQKKLPSPFETKLLRRLAKKIVFDFDDAIYYRHDSSESLESNTRYFKFKYLTQNVDIVIAGNKILADFAMKFNNNVVILPSSVETRNIPIKDHRNVNEKTVIGWVGGANNLIHLKLLSPLLQRLSQEYRIQLRVLSSEILYVPGLEVNFVPWRLESQEREISAFDIGVMPLPKNKHTEAKCGYKALQYMASAVPPVVSDVGVNREIVEDKKEGLVVPSIESFYDALKTLIEDVELRREMGFNARKKVEEHFSVSVIGKKLADILKM